MIISTLDATQPYTRPGAGSSATGAASANSGVSAPGSLPGMDGSQFMMLVLAQMRNQNPLEPMDDKELIAQMAQLNSLSELQKINYTLQAVLQAVQAGEQGGGEAA